MNAFRLSVLWERLQPQLGAPLNEAELARLMAATQDLTKLGAWVIIDVHNYARYRGDTIGSPDVPVAALADLWGQLASHFADQDRVILDLMNEPHDISTAIWVHAANAAISAIRHAGARNIIFVGGNTWSGAHKWYDRVDGESNAEAMLKIVDPLERTVFEAHLYLDGNSSGTSADCVSETIGVERLQPFTRWLKENHKLGFIGEFGAGASSECLTALANMVRFMNEHSDILIGWTYWGAGPWWPKDYFTLLEPQDGKDVPQMQALKPFLAKPPVISSRGK
jgi:endoglucanase